MRLRHWGVLALGAAAAACASTIGPVIPSVQVLVVLDSTDDTLRIIPVDSLDVVHKVVLGIAASDKHALALRGQFAAIGSSGTVAYYDLTSHNGLALSPTCESKLDSGNIRSLAFDGNGVVYAAVPTTNGAPHLDPTSGQPCPSGTGHVRGHPVAFVLDARSHLFVVTGTCLPAQLTCAETTSWLASPFGEPLADTVQLTDSIPLSLPGNAQGAVLASDGNLYVINAGNGLAADARLSQFDPVGLTEHNVYNGFGTLPQYIATDGERVFVASEKEGLMVFNSRTSVVERDYRSAIQLVGAPRGLATDDVGRVYVLIAGPCTPGGSGSVQVLGTDLVSRRGPTVGHCPVAVAVTDIPSTLYHFDN
jgi:hypothetical protein